MESVSPHAPPPPPPFPDDDADGGGEIAASPLPLPPHLELLADRNNWSSRGEERGDVDDLGMFLVQATNKGDKQVVLDSFEFKFNGAARSHALRSFRNRRLRRHVEERVSRTDPGRRDVKKKT